MTFFFCHIARATIALVVCVNTEMFAIVSSVIRRFCCVLGPTGTSDESVFLGKLAFLSDHADVFLRMLNELRRKLKGLRPELSITRNYK